MPSNSKLKITAKLNKRASAQISMLVIIFLLGMAVNLLGVPGQLMGSAKTIATVLLSLHIFLALGLLIGAIWLVLISKSASGDTKRLTWLGAIIIVLTILTGIGTIGTLNNWWSFAMSVGFIVSFLIYGKIYVKTRKS